MLVSLLKFCMCGVGVGLEVVVGCGGVYRTAYAKSAATASETLFCLLSLMCKVVDVGMFMVLRYFVKNFLDGFLYFLMVEMMMVLKCCVKLRDFKSLGNLEF